LLRFHEAKSLIFEAKTKGEERKAIRLIHTFETSTTFQKAGV
jgi:hypothetical protein